MMTHHPIHPPRPERVEAVAAYDAVPSAAAWQPDLRSILLHPAGEVVGAAAAAAMGIL
jgi:hypothetical protein